MTRFDGDGVAELQARFGDDGDSTVGRGRRAVVIGAGIAGLATAALLARDGWKVAVLESGDEVGGRVGIRERDGYRFDTGPSWYLMPEVFDHFFRLLGTTSAEQLDLVDLDPGYRVYGEDEPAPIDVVRGRAGNVAAFEAVEPGAGEALGRYLDSSADAYDVALDRFLYTTFQSFAPLLSLDTVRRMPRLVRLLTGSLEKFAGEYVTDRRLRQILGYPAVFLGSAPNDTPALYHLMSHLDLEDGVRYPMGGFSTIIDSIAGLAELEGVDVHTATRVTRIRTAPAGRGVQVTGVDVTTADGRVSSIDADIVVSAADQHHTQHELIADPKLRDHGARWWKTRDAGPGAVLFMVAVRGALPELEHHTLFFTKDWDTNFSAIFGAHKHVPSPASVYVCRPSATDPSVAPDGHENLFVLVPVPAAPTLGAPGDDRVTRLQAEVIVQIGGWAGIEGFADRIEFVETKTPADFAREHNAWRGGALGPGHSLKQSAFFRGRNASPKIAGLYAAGGTTLPGVGLPMCLISAELVIKSIRGDTSGGPLAEPLAPARVRDAAVSDAARADAGAPAADPSVDTSAAAR